MAIENNSEMNRIYCKISLWTIFVLSKYKVRSSVKNLTGSRNDISGK